MGSAAFDAEQVAADGIVSEGTLIQVGGPVLEGW